MDDSIKVHYASSDGELPYIPDDRAIVELCKEAYTANNNITKLSRSVLAKHGNVSLEECRNQVEARRLLDPNIVLVPKVYRYFSKGPQNYLVMEFVDGVVRDVIEDDESVTKIARMIKHFQTYRSEIPGPLGGGISRGLFWENEHVELKSISRLEEYLSHRLIGDQKGLHVTVKELVLNHNDIAPRNIIWMTNGSICLIDWSHAGYYPPLLERVVLFFNTQQGKDLGFTVLLAEKLGPLTDDEETELHALHMAWFNSHRYVIKPLDGKVKYQLEIPPIPCDSPRKDDNPRCLPYRPVRSLKIVDAKTFSEQLWQDLQKT